jgi:hypothetical protein
MRCAGRNFALLGCYPSHPARPRPRTSPCPLPPLVGFIPFSPPFGSLATALPALTQLRAATSRDADVSGLTGLRRLAVTAKIDDDERCTAVEGLSGLTALEDLRLECEHRPWARPLTLAQPSDLAPLTALTRLAMTCVPPALGSLPLAARLRRLEMQAFGAAPSGGGGGGAAGTAAAALAALARGAPLLERLRIHVKDREDWGDCELEDPPDELEPGAPLGAGVAWPSLTHLQTTPWAAVLLAGCTFPRLSRLVAWIDDEDGADPSEGLLAAVAALAAKARDHVVLRVVQHWDCVLAAAAAVPGLRHLSWSCRWYGPGGVAPSCDWARLAPSLESLEFGGVPGRLCRGPDHPNVPDSSFP